MKDFINLKSANESKVWLALLKDNQKADKKEAENLIAELKEISNILHLLFEIEREKINFNL